MSTRNVSRSDRGWGVRGRYRLGETEDNPGADKMHGERYAEGQNSMASMTLRWIDSGLAVDGNISGSSGWNEGNARTSGCYFSRALEGAGGTRVAKLVRKENQAPLKGVLLKLSGEWRVTQILQCLAAGGETWAHGQNLREGNTIIGIDKWRAGSAEAVFVATKEGPYAGFDMVALWGTPRAQNRPPSTVFIELSRLERWSPSPLSSGGHGGLKTQTGLPIDSLKPGSLVQRRTRRTVEPLGVASRTPSNSWSPAPSNQSPTCLLHEIDATTSDPWDTDNKPSPTKPRSRFQQRPTIFTNGLHLDVRILQMERTKLASTCCDVTNPYSVTGHASSAGLDLSKRTAPLCTTCMDSAGSPASWFSVPGYNLEYPAWLRD
ncbi:hypothetical protein F5I97DRAFT_1826919 [Phlebopus sp. FC_14]|nr:hypothetical protein F5I97DRAFT_1826919 [Phlebopus sp. FC_14]